jgi:5-methyltetrahydrofolate--homocysteine methyltransferase
MEEHANYAGDFLNADRWIKRTCRRKVSGGVSNISSRSAGNNWSARRCTPPSCSTPIKAGMDMGIVNAGQLAVYDRRSQGPLEHARTSC